jgi:uncharacterized membrane protein
MASFCSSCGAQVADGAAFCPACGKSSTQSTGGGAAAAPAQSQSTAGGLTDNVAGMLAYIPALITGIIFLVVEPYNKRPFVRFHAFQSIFFGIAMTVLWIAVSILGLVPVLGWATILLWPILFIGGVIVWIVLLLKANQGQKFKLPIIGDMAEKQANA